LWEPEPILLALDRGWRDFKPADDGVYLFKGLAEKLEFISSLEKTSG